MTLAVVFFLLISQEIRQYFLFHCNLYKQKSVGRATMSVTFADMASFGPITVSLAKHYISDPTVHASSTCRPHTLR